MLKAVVGNIVGAQRRGSDAIFRDRSGLGIDRIGRAIGLLKRRNRFGWLRARSQRDLARFLLRMFMGWALLMSHRVQKNDKRMARARQAEESSCVSEPLVGGGLPTAASTASAGYTPSAAAPSAHACPWCCSSCW